MKSRRWLAAALLLAGGTPAHAQWEWKDANNVRHFSDQPPPLSVPAARILKAPRGQLPDLRRELAEPPAAEPAPATRLRPSVADREAESGLRRQQAAEAAGKAQAEARNKAANAAACDSARGNLRVLESGIRVATTNEAGEPAFLDEAGKAEQIRRNRDTLATLCK